MFTVVQMLKHKRFSGYYRVVSKFKNKKHPVDFKPLKFVVNRVFILAQREGFEPPYSCP